MVSRPELFFALVGAVGTDLKAIVRALGEELRAVGYVPLEIRLSDLIADCYAHRALKAKKGGPEDDRIDSFMDAGDQLRSVANRGDAVALLALMKIQALRSAKGGAERRPIDNYAFILNSLKHPDEVRTLRKLYGDALVVVSVYSPERRRVETLTKRIARSRDSRRPIDFTENALKLVRKDEKEVGNELGQSVRDAYPLADLFVTQQDSPRMQINRFVRLFFGHPFVTPTIDEYCMFHAKAAALRSADLSRQVGATVATSDGEIIGTGCNEVPRAGGGSVWEGKAAEERDYRDFKLGYDTSTLMKQEMLAELFGVLKAAGWLSPKLGKSRPEQLARRALYDGPNPIAKEIRVANIIEFGRIVHAEMSAISDAARRGLSVKSQILYCTTFPCHMCARHIVSSGIGRVVYIEPYPKSMAKELYKSMIRVDHDEADDDAVQFEPFVGLAPERYFGLFQMVRRKDESGYALEWSAENAAPRLTREAAQYLETERAHVAFLQRNAVKFGITARA
jgi:cytidine deaminase